jgi:hypothetical protein
MSGRFSAQEWSVIAGAPLPAGTFVIAGGRGGMRSTLAAVRGYAAPTTPSSCASCRHATG